MKEIARKWQQIKVLRNLDLIRFREEMSKTGKIVSEKDWMIAAMLALTKQLEPRQAAKNPAKREEQSVAGPQEKPLTADKEMAEEGKTPEAPGDKREVAEDMKEAREESQSEAKNASTPH